MNDSRTGGSNSGRWRSRGLLLAVAVIAGTTIQPATAEIALAAQDKVPSRVDHRVLRDPPTGETLIAGRLVDARGRAAKGRVAVLVWPSADTLRSVKVRSGN